MGSPVSRRKRKVNALAGQSQPGDEIELRAHAGEGARATKVVAVRARFLGPEGLGMTPFWGKGDVAGKN